MRDETHDDPADGPPATTRGRVDGPLWADRAILRLIAQGAPLVDILDRLVRAVEAQADGMIGSILFVEDGRLRHGAAPHLPADYTRAIDGEPIGPAAGSCGTAAYRREAVIVEDIATDPLWAPYRAFALGAGLSACWSVPILAQGAVVGTFALYYTEPRRPTPALLDLVRHAADLAAVAIERHRREAALVDSESFARAIVENALDANVIIDADGIVTGWSGRAEDIFGWSREEALGRRLSTLVIPARYRADHERGLQRFRETGSGRMTHRRVEMSALHRDGHEFPVALALSPIRLGGRLLFSAFISDLTARHRLEEELRQFQKMEALGSLTGGVAHDFNNLLTVILGYGDMLIDRIDPAHRAEVQAILDAGQRASDLTNQLLAFARKQDLQPRRIDLNTVVSGLQDMLRRLIREDIVFSTSLAEELGPVLADPGQIEQVVVNLSVNARDAIEGAGTLSFETSNVHLDATRARRHPGVAPGPYVRLAIRDTGRGMDEALQARVFEPFFTTKPKGMGTGLGLSTVYGIVKQSGGHIGLHSVPGEGTTFEILLPRADEAPPPPAPRSDPGRHAPGVGVVVLVEDEPALRALCARMLEDLGYAVVVVADAQAAFEMLQRDGVEPDLLVTDVIMPGLGGRALAARLRERWSGLRVLYMSGYSGSPNDDPETFDATLLHKPFTRAALAAAVRAALEG